MRDLSTTTRWSYTASPSLALEKNAYRMRAPRTRLIVSSTPRHGSRTRQRNLFVTRENQTVILIALLASVILTCFGTAYYLFMTRWASSALSLHHSTSDPHDNLQAIPYNLDEELRLFSPGPQQRYLGYLPHSGFHNQRIAFENALILSRLLNRTLLVPPIRLGEKPVRYVKFDTLRQYLAISGKEGLHHCLNVPTRVSSSPEECFDYFDYTHIPWEWLVNLTEVKVTRSLLQVWNFTEEWPYDNLQISETDTLTLRDTHPYEYRFLDSLTYRSLAKDKFIKTVHIPTLAQSSERLIQIGTLFGSSRLRLKQPENLRIRGDIRRSMAFSNPSLVDAVNSIRDALGGTYLGAHVRVGDSHFKDNSQANIRLIWWQLLHKVLNFGSEETLRLEHQMRRHNSYLEPPHFPVDYAALRVPHPPVESLPKIFTPHLPCRGARYTSHHLKPLNIPLFISTDAQDPFTDSSILIFMQTFPCTFFLSDFPSYMASLNELRNGYDGVDMREFLTPFLDAMVVSKAWQVVGTEGSTFSRFVQDVLWRTYHGWDIVQRG